MPTWFGALVKGEPSKLSPNLNPEAPSSSGVSALVVQPGKCLQQRALAFGGTHRQQEKTFAWKLL